MVVLLGTVCPLQLRAPQCDDSDAALPGGNRCTRIGWGARVLWREIVRSAEHVLHSRNGARRGEGRKTEALTLVFTHN
eukprot:2164182-Rhodomonas_salina.1